jgi:hypothetical protein
MFAKSNLRSFTSSPTRITLTLLLTALLVFPDGTAFAATYTCSGTTPWHTSGATLPYPLETFGAATNGTRMYVIGGYDNVDNIFPTFVYHKALSAIATSSVSSNWYSNSLWTDSATGEVVGLSRDLCGTIYTSTTGTSYIYTVGGVYFDTNTDPTGNTTSDVWYAPINSSNGNVGTWTQTSSLPVALQLHGTVVLNGYMYVIGGSTDPHGDTKVSQYTTNAVHYAKINSDGSLGSWDPTSLPAIPNPAPGTGLYKTCPVAYNGSIYVSGGETSGSSVNQVVYATPATTGTNIGSFSSWTNNSSNYIVISGTAVADAAQAVVYDNGITLIAGDQTGSGGNTNCVFQGAVNTTNGDVTWSTPSSISPVPINVSRNTGAASSSNIFSLGGLTGSAGNDTKAIYYWP